MSWDNEALDEKESLLTRKRRRFAMADIKLLRLALIAKETGPCQGLSVEWIPAQPSENLSPFAAAGHLNIAAWSLRSEVKRRYRKLQLRYPPEQFSEKHLDWRPSADLLASPVARLNWYWQSGLVPGDEMANGCEGELLSSRTDAWASAVQGLQHYTSRED